MAFAANRNSAQSGTAGKSDPYKVMVVDDSAVIRGLITRWLEEDPMIKVVSSASNGLQAVNNVAQVAPDVVVLDIEMPEMDGLTALPKILEKCPEVRVVMASTLTRRNADISMRAMTLGAADYVPKPELARGAEGKEFHRELVEKVKTLAAAKRGASTGGAGAGSRQSPVPIRRFTSESRKPERARTQFSAQRQETSAVRPVVGGASAGDAPIQLKDPSRTIPKILAIGSSTGGPKALFQFLADLKNDLSNVPIMITQHMPPTFTSILAEHIHGASGLEAKEGQDGEVVRPGVVYVAPGDYHMYLTESGGVKKIKTDQAPQVNFCRPAVDPMFESISKIYGAATLGVILTGMGQDGCEGGRIVVNGGGTILAQDKATSVVWGMPGAAAGAGICAAVEPLNELSIRTRNLLKGGRL